MSRAATIYDIAREAETSTSTVSRVLNGSALVGDSVAARVRDAADRLDYQSRRIRRPRARAVLRVIVFLPHTARPQTHLFYDAATLFTGIQHGFGDIRHHLIVSLSDSTDAMSAKKLGDIDGCIFAFCAPSDDMREQLRSRGIPAVLVNRTDSEMSFVCNDAAAGIQRLSREIAAARPKSGVAFISVSDAGPVADYRVNAFHRVKDSLRGAGTSRSVRRFDTVTEITGSALGDMYSGGVRVFMCLNDYVAITVLDRLRQLGLSVPGEVAVTGYDNSPVRQLISTEITTVDLSVADLGGAAAALLGKQILDRSEGREALFVEGRFIRGQSL